MRRPTRSVLRLALLLALVVSLPSLTATAQQNPADDAAGGDAPPSLFIDRVDVNVVNVEVFVTDERGRRVTGLERDDFVLLQDGEPVEISNFFAVTRQDRVALELEQQTAGLMERPEAAQPAPESRVMPADQRLNLVVYVDHKNINPQSRQAVLDELDGFLEDRAFQGDNVMLVGYDGKLEVVQPFTGDRRLIDSAIQRLRRAPAGRPAVESQRRAIMRSMKMFQNDSNGPQIAYDAMHGFVERERAELRRSTEALLQLVRALAGLPGRKAVLYVSDGLPARPGEEMFLYLEQIFNPRGIAADPVAPSTAIEAAREDEGHLFNRVSRVANANQVTLYTLDARGSAGHTSIAADYRGDIDIAPGGHRNLDMMRTQNYQGPLLELAEATGGRALLNSDDFASGMERLATDFDSFYSLGFQTPPQGKGEYHELEVRVKRPGMQVRHRAGYEDRPEEERVADRTLSSLMLDMQQNPLAVAVDFGEPERKKDKEYLLPVLIRIPFDEVTLLPNGEVRQGRLKIFVAVKDDRGGISPLFSTPYEVQVPAERVQEAAGRDIGYGLTLRLKPGIPRVAVAVWDEVSGTESFVHKEVIVGDVERKEAERR